MSTTEEIDALETKEWLDALTSMIRTDGPARAEFVLQEVFKKAGTLGCQIGQSGETPYCNTIPTTAQPSYPGDLELERNIRSMIRWNAAVMVVKAGNFDSSLGGHIGTFASAATLYDVGFHHFWRAPSKDHPGDMIFFQGHASPGIYARSFLEGRLSENQLNHFRREVGGGGLCSYPHPQLMPEYWQFPTVSMGLGPLQAIYAARFMKYLENRTIIPKSDRKIWCFCGDGEMDEPESLGAISLASREKLDNLIFVINCNLQRLDGPVRGNGKIIQELEGAFKGAKWDVVKVIWGGLWDPLFEKDKTGLLLKRMEEALDGEYQSYKAHDGGYTRERFFGKYPKLKELVSHLSDDEIFHLNRGGHDPEKVYAAYYKAVNQKDKPTVILAKTIKGYGLGDAGEALNIAHNVKKMTQEQLQVFRDRFHVPVSDKELESGPVFYRPKKNSKEEKYLQEKRSALGGFLPQRRTKSDEKLKVPPLELFKTQLESSGKREISTTMALVRMMASLCRDKILGKRIVPIVPDEARTFGMEGLFPQLGIYAPFGQKYEPVDSKQVMYYKESKTGQILEEGINEAGAFSSWIAAATSYSTHNKILIPIYIYYSMFGFQRIGDLAWAAGDQHARGFLIGATSGRTTLNGEGLQHQDGHSHVLANTIPNCKTYDPSFAYELAVIVHAGLQEMVEQQKNVFYYITTLNENYVHMAMPKGVEAGILKGMYPLRVKPKKQNHTVQLLGSGAILQEVLAAHELLEKDYQIGSEVWSVTSFNELAKDGIEIERQNRLQPLEKPKKAYITTCLEKTTGPIVAATDYMKQHAMQALAFVEKTKVVLGTNGFGRSDTRAALRDYFEVSRHHVVIGALKALADDGAIDVKMVQDAISRYSINVDRGF